MLRAACDGRDLAQSASDDSEPRPACVRDWCAMWRRMSEQTHFLKSLVGNLQTRFAAFSGAVDARGATCPA